jgi:hypothetical protein
MGGACGTHGRGEKSIQGFGGKAHGEKDRSEDRGVDGRMDSEWVLEKKQIITATTTTFNI